MGKNGNKSSVWDWFDADAYNMCIAAVKLVLDVALMPVALGSMLRGFGVSKNITTKIAGWGFSDFWNFNDD